MRGSDPRRTAFKGVKDRNLEKAMKENRSGDGTMYRGGTV